MTDNKLPVHLIALERINRQLTNLGCKYKIISHDGVEYGDLEVVAPKPPASRAYRRVIDRIDYKAVLDSLAPGEHTVIECPEDLPAAAVQAALAGYASKKYGAGAVMTSQRGTALEVLRLE